MSGKKLHKTLLQSAQLFAVQVRTTSTEVKAAVKEPKFAQLLEEYTDNFKEPTSLPPHSSHDHKIILK